VISDDETLDDGGDAPSSIDNSSDTAGRVSEVFNAFDNPDPVLAWRLANMPDDALLLFEIMDFELQEISPQ